MIAVPLLLSPAGATARLRQRTTRSRPVGRSLRAVAASHDAAKHSFITAEASGVISGIDAHALFLNMRDFGRWV